LLAAHRQGGYEQLRDAIMVAPPQTTKAMIKEAAEGLGLDWARLARDMDDPAIQTQIEENLKLAQAIGVHGTPAMLIGDALVPGAVDLPELQRAVAAARKAR
jgi:protein-disulfide isomerase